MNVKTKQDFDEIVSKIQAKKFYKQPLGFGIARVDRGQLNSQKILQANFALINWKENYKTAAVFLQVLKTLEVEFNTSSELIYTIDKKFIKQALKYFKPFVEEKNHKNIDVLKYLKEVANNDGLGKNYQLVMIFDDEKPKSVQCVYLKLYALSLKKAKLRSLNLDGAFGVLENVAWSMNMPIELEWLRENEIALKLEGSYPAIDMVDKFPRFLAHIIPEDNTRVLDSSKVRMGAALASGTTIMPGASYVNFNAGTTGSVMVEGRISSSVIVGKGSDIGGGASILGVLSGTNGNPISIGENTLLGANSVTGIPLGDGCIVDAGVAILEGTKVFISSEEQKKLKQVNDAFPLNDTQIYKAINLSNQNALHFRLDSQSGKIIAKRSNKEIKLNKDLH